MHCPPLQHPPGQLDALQPEPPAQAWFEHVAPPTQVSQVLPPLPQALLAVPATHWPPLQQPFGHVEELQLAWHAWPVHDSPVLQVSHVAPPLPHAVSLVPSTHWPSGVQQPLEQVDALQVAVG
jgi:hypothetical protein